MGAARIIFHIDMNAFFASCEMAEKPYLRGKPIVISRGDATSRSAICSTASYEARRFGVKSAMPLSIARRLCPNLIPVESHFELYEAYSARMMNYLRTITPQIEPASIDEAYLDVSSYLGKTDIPRLALAIQKTLYREQHLPCSIGIAPNKFLAKMASDMKKPLGITILRKRDLATMLWPLAIEVMFGVGKKTAPRLRDAGFSTIGSLLAPGAKEKLERLFGVSFASYLTSRAAGIDDDPVVDHTKDLPQSIEREMTFAHDLENPFEINGYLHGLLGSVLHRLESEHLDAEVAGIILKHADFTRITRQRILDAPTHDEHLIKETIDELFDQYFRAGYEVRLAGAFVARLSKCESSMEQPLTLFTDYDAIEKKEALARLLKDINEAYGSTVIRRGCLEQVNEKEKRIMRIGDYSDFTVERETDLGYMLCEVGVIDREKELFLHHNECLGAALVVGQAVKAYVYVDKKGRLAATLRKAEMTQSHGGFGTVTAISPALGAFVFYGPSKDALLSKDDLPQNIASWPKVGAKIPGVIRPHGGKLLIKMMNKPEMLALESAPKLALGDKVTGYVYRMTDAGINLATADFHIIFVHVSQIMRTPSLGEACTVRITKVNDVDYNGTLKPTPAEEEEARKALEEANQQKIIDYLIAHDSLMTITDKSSPLVIEKVFKMSKLQFKEALGRLYKEKKVFLAPDRVILL